MPEYRRAKALGTTYFFTVVTYERQALLTDENVRNALRSGIQWAREKFPFTNDAWVLLPDHLHCIWTLPVDDANFSARWAIIKRHVSQRCHGASRHREQLTASRRKRNELAFWQRRFWEHQIRNEADFKRHVDYIHWNPVKHGHVAKVADWPYSTFHRYVADGVYPEDWGGVASSLAGLDFGE